MLLLGSDIRDYTSGFIAGRAHLFREIRLHGDYGEYCIRLLTQARRAATPSAKFRTCACPAPQARARPAPTCWDYLVKGRKYVETIVRLAVSP